MSPLPNVNVQDVVGVDEERDTLDVEPEYKAEGEEPM